MARAPYDTTLMVYPYPLGGVWGPAIDGPYPCRLVVQTQLVMDGSWLEGCDHWVTTNVNLGDPAWDWEPGDEFVTADLTLTVGLAIPHTAAPSFIVVQRLVATPLESPPYWRYYLRQTSF